MRTIPVVDIRSETFGSLARLWPDRARALIKAARQTLGPFSDLALRALLPTADRLSRDWLIRTGNPYRDEIRRCAESLGVNGVYTFNLCFEWGCTSGVLIQDRGPLLARVLDWPFPHLGENVVVAHQRGDAGAFFNVTWPGISGMFQGIAPGRFAACINQAPMQRHRLTYAGDWAKNRRQMFRSGGLPPAHLLRHVFETEGDFEIARERLARTPIALPAIFILAGVADDEGCVIERTGHGAVVRPLVHDRVFAANHFEAASHATRAGWRPRPIDSIGRAQCARQLTPDAFEDGFAWFRPPIANAHSRLVFAACARTGAFDTFGVHGPKPVTEVLRHRAV
jgi:hypothetical protein